MAGKEKLSPHQEFPFLNALLCPKKTHKGKQPGQACPLPERRNQSANKHQTPFLQLAEVLWYVLTLHIALPARLEGSLPESG